MRFLLDFLFPPLCLHCKRLSPFLFCRGCASFFELIDPSNRCPYCFSDQETNGVCRECVQSKNWGVRMAAALDYLGPVRTLVHKLKNGQRDYLAKTGSSFMALQWDRLEWSLPDAIIPIPPRRGFQKENHATLLARELAQLWTCRLYKGLKREWGALPYGRISPTQCRESRNTFFIRGLFPSALQTLLLVDDVIHTGTTIRQAAQVLKEAGAKRVYALALAATQSRVS